MISFMDVWILFVKMISFIFIFILYILDWESVKGYNFDRIDVNLLRVFFIFRLFYKIICEVI